MDTPPAVMELDGLIRLLAEQRGADRLVDAVARAMDAAVEAVGQPMYVAVTGQVKRGKSTLINALTRLQIAATGVDDVTTDFHEFHFGDGTPSAPLAGKPRKAWRRKMPAHIISAVPAELPRGLRLIDTPGLGSPVYDTEANAGLRADCALHLFDRNVHQADADYLRGLLAKEGVQPLPTRVLGIISACDRAWPPGQDQASSPDPLTFEPLRDGVETIAAQIERNPVNHELFYAVLPVAALVAEGGWALTPDQVQLLAGLAKRLDERALAAHLQSAARFVDSDLVADGIQRRALLELLGPWGVHLACRYLRDASATEPGLRQHLDERSGVARLRAEVLDHFVGRAGSIKLEQHLRRIEKALAKGRTTTQLAGTALPAELIETGRRLERIRTMSWGLSELSLVELINRHRNRVTAVETAHLAELTGTRGATCMERLGLDAHAGVPVMLERAVERQRHWIQRGNVGAELSATVVRAYERLIARISDARTLLNSPD